MSLLSLDVFAAHPRARAAVFASALSLLSTPLFAASSALTLDQATRLAVQRAPLLDARRAGVTAAQQEARRAAALPDPTLSLGIQDLPVTGADAFDFSADNFTMKKIGVRQAFPARAKRNARQTLADRTIDQAEALTSAEALMVKRKTAEAWVSLWAARNEVEALQDLREQSRLAVGTARARLGGGTGTAAEVLATQAAALELENRLDAALAQVESARAMFNRWLGENADAATDATPDFTQLPVSEAVLLQSIDRQGPLLPWQAREQVASAQVDLASAEKRPDWSVGMSYGQRNRFSDFVSVEFSIDLPLFGANRQDRGVAARRADYEATLDAHEDARRAQLEQVRTDLAQWAGFKRQVTRDQEQLLPLARDRAAVTVASYGAGGALQPWLDARRDEIEIRTSHARRSGELGRAWAALAYLLPSETSP